MGQYLYMNDIEFLKALDNETYKKQFIRILVLDFQTENVLATIEGKSTGGSCNLSGTSNMRRTASCSVAVDPNGIYVNGYAVEQDYYNITTVNNLISLNKKIKIQTGFINTLKEQYPMYQEESIIWIPMGTYVIKNASISKNNSGINISLTLNDKCALLNGDMGGVIPAATVFSEMEEYSLDGTEKIKKKTLIKDIIRTLVTEFGGELADNIIISDIDDYAVKVMKWNGKNSVYFIENEKQKQLTLQAPSSGSYVTYNKGDYIGYTLEPFTYPGVLECQAGESVASVLDKIRDTLGNYEWFYNVNGQFVFQQIKNYVNTSLASSILAIKEDEYTPVATPTGIEYSFDNSNKHLISSISNAPQYPNIKNDFTVWGTKKTSSGATKPIRYHLAFDQKPVVNADMIRYAIVYTDQRRLQSITPIMDRTCRLGTPSSNSDPKYLYIDSNGLIWKYDAVKKPYGFKTQPNYTICGLKTDDWRGELYYYGLWEDTTFSNNPYIAEMSAEWPKIWNAKKSLERTENAHTITIGETSIELNIPIYKGGYIENLSQLDYEYWIDFLEGSTEAGYSELSISNIGRRSKVVSDTNINCLFETEIPNYIYILADGNVTEDLQAAETMPYEIIQVNMNIYSQMSIGGGQNSAFGKIKELLRDYTQYNESISLSVIPIYHLEPNTRISIYDNSIGVYGSYLIKSISLPFATNGTSTISASKCIEKTF